MRDIYDTNPSDFSSSDHSGSSVICRSHFDGYSFRVSDAALAEYLTDQRSRVPPCEVHDTLDICDFHGPSPQYTPIKEPTTPNKRPTPAKIFDENEPNSKSFAASSPSAHLFDSKSSAYFSGRSSLSSKTHDESRIDESFNRPGFMTESGAYYSDQSGASVSTHPLMDTLDVCYYRRSMPQFLVTPEKSTISIHEPNSPGPVTSSPLRTIDDITDEKFIEPDDLNSTLERVNYRLAVCGYVPPSPSRMAKRKRLMEVYVAELLQQEAAERTIEVGHDAKKKKNIASSNKPRKTIKRTISVDESLKLLL